MAETGKPSENIVKVRDDHEPISFCWDTEKNIFIPKNKQESGGEPTLSDMSKSICQ